MPVSYDAKEQSIIYYFVLDQHTNFFCNCAEYNIFIYFVILDSFLQLLLQPLRDVFNLRQDKGS